jgi:hypothetical protein
MAKKGAAELSYEQVYQELAPVLLIKSAVKQP